MSVAQCGIPYEIWDHIYAHLVDPYNFNKTRSFEEICRATRDIGVRWRYRTVHTSSPRFLCDIRRLACEGKTESFPNGAYVRTLRVDADCTLECISDELRCSGSRSEELLAFVLSHMPNVQKLVADQVSGNFASDFPSNVFLSRGSRLLDAGWAAFGNNLQALELRTPFETLASILPHDLSLPNLHDLNFQFGTNPDRDFDDNEVDESLFWLQPFFSKHTPQLVSLAVSTHLLCDPSIVLEGIPSASKLRIFSFRSYYLPDDEEPTNRTFEFNGLERILTMSQGHLEELTLNWFPTLGSTWKLVGEDDPKYDAPWWRHPSMHIPFPNLTSLTLQYDTQASASLPNIPRFVCQFGGSLTQLKIDYTTLSMSNLQTLLSGLQRSSPVSASFEPSTHQSSSDPLELVAPPLRILRIEIPMDDINARTLVMIAKALPYLSDLSFILCTKDRLRCHDCSRDWERFRRASTLEENSRPFIDSFTHLGPSDRALLAAWELRSLNLCSDLRRSRTRSCGRYLLDALPNLQCIDRLSRQQFSQNPWGWLQWLGDHAIVIPQFE